MNIGKVKETEITSEMQKSYLDYAMSVIVSRALPDVRDGLKPVHRRILFAMHQIGLHHTARFSKSAKVVGEVLGKYHPHGDAPVYEALVRLAQNFSMRYPLITGQGNFGSVDGDPPAAMRYTECRLSPISQEMLYDIEKQTVNFLPNFDTSLEEPIYMPAKLPNLLLMGSDGIAVGMATKIPPHNLSEVCDAIIYLIQNVRIKEKEKDINSLQKISFLFDSTLENLLTYIKGPDFPTGGSIYDINEIKTAYGTGRGKIVIRAKTDIEELRLGKSAIIITEIPYQVNKALLVAKIADLVKDKKIQGISDLRDESDRRGIRVVVELKRDAKPKKVLNNLYKFTQLQTTFAVNMVALIDHTPQTCSLKTILEEYIKHRYNVVFRRSTFELKEAKARAHILDGLKIAVDNIDAVITTIKRSNDTEDAKVKLMKQFGLTEIQAVAILDMQLKRLAALERQKIEDELAITRETIQYLEDLLARPKKILSVIKGEVEKLQEKYGDVRKTRVYKSKVGEFSDEELIPNEKTLITMSTSGYIKRVPKTTFKTQGRGGKGVIGMTTKQEDTIDKIVSAQTHDNMLFFTDYGRVYQVRVWDILEATRQSKGQAVVNLINITQGERVTSVLTYNPGVLKQKDADIRYIFMATKKGTVKKTHIRVFERIRSNGLVAIKLNKGDELIWSKLTSGNNEIFLATHDGKSIRFNEKEVRPTGRDTMGVRGVAVKKEDYVISCDVITSDMKKADFLAIMEKGLGKKTNIDQFPRQRRGGQGVKVAEVTRKTGKVVVSQIIPKSCTELVLTSSKGQVVKLPIETIPRLTRTTSGVILMRFAKHEDSIAAATCVTS